MTLHDRFVTALIARGSQVVKRGKYTSLTRNKRTSDDKPTFYFVGSAGAVRVGRSATRSIPVSDSFKAALLAAAPAKQKRTSIADKLATVSF